MSWRQSNSYELSNLEAIRRDDPAIFTLVSYLILAPRIEPLLLRNARLKFAPQLQAEVESQLWFSPLVAARSNNEIILIQGIASELSKEWIPHSNLETDKKA